MSSRDTIIEDLERAERLLHEAYKSLSNEEFLIDTTDNLKSAHSGVREAGELLHQQIDNLKRIREFI